MADLTATVLALHRPMDPAARKVGLASLCLILLLALPALLIGLTPTQGYSPGDWAATGVLLIAGVNFAVVVFGSHVRAYAAVFWTFVYIFLGMAPLVQSRLAALPATTPWIREGLYPHAWSVVYAGILAYVAGVALGHLLPSRPSRPAQPGGGRLVIVATGATLLVAFLMLRIGIAAFFTDRYQFADAAGAVAPDPVTGVFIFGVGTMGILVACLSLTGHMRFHDVRIWQWALAAVPFMLLVVFINPLTSPRFLVGILALSIAAAAGALGSLRNFRVLFVALLVGMTTVFPFLNLFRVASGAAATGTPLEALASADYDAFVQIVNTVDFVSAAGQQNGRQLSGALLFFVPRAMWPAKPEDTGVLLAQYQHYGFDNLSAPLWAEFYMDGGFLGVAVGFLLVGLLVTKLDERLESQVALTGWPSLVNCVLPFYFLMILRGSLLQAMSQVAALLFCVGLMTFGGPPRKVGEARQVLRIYGTSARSEKP